MSIATDKEFATVLKQMGEIKAHIAGYEKLLKPLEKELEALKSETMAYMQSTKSKRSEAVNGYCAIRTVRKDFEVKDEPAVIKWLRKNKFVVSSYIHLDKAMVKATQKGVLEMNGEIIPGVEATEKEYITIKEVK